MLMFILDYKVHSFWRGPESGRRGVEDWCSKVTSESCWKQDLADNLLLFFSLIKQYQSPQGDGWLRTNCNE